jgi:predicted amidophosphoribosyltransferase
MDSTFRTDRSTMDLTQVTHVPVCRTINCGRDAPEIDTFCDRCREEIDAVRDTARRRFVIFGASGRKARARST